MIYKKELEVFTNLHILEETKRDEIVRIIGNKLAIIYLEFLKNPQFDSREVCNNLNINKN